MFTVELKFKVAEREVSVDRFVEALVSKVSDTVRTELRQHTFGAVQAPSQPGPQPKAVSINKAAELIGVSKRTLWGHVQTGTLKVTRIGRRVLIPSHTLDRIVREGLPRLRQNRQLAP